MRKLVLELKPSEMIKNIQKPIFEHIYRYEVLEMLSIDYEDGIKIGLMEIYTKDDIEIQDLKLPEMVEIISILKSEGKKYTCVIKVNIPEDMIKEFQKSKLNLIWTTPLGLSQDKITYSCIGDQESISKFIEMMKNYGEIVNMRFLRAAYQEHDILSVLTDKQREIVIAAKKYGYYEFPKKINSRELSEKVNISKPTLIQHLRKAETRLMSNILAGYDTR